MEVVDLVRILDLIKGLSYLKGWPFDDEVKKGISLNRNAKVFVSWIKLITFLMNKKTLK